jgi:hypothetical protein
LSCSMNRDNKKGKGGHCCWTALDVRRIGIEGRDLKLKWIQNRKDRWKVGWKKGWKNIQRFLPETHADVEWGACTEFWVGMDPLELPVP